MATITTDLICNLNQPVAATFLHGNLFSQDNAGNTINVHVMDNGEPATIGGTVSANVIRADGNTVAVSGSLSGNQCSVVLPQACYAVPGRVEIIIKLTQSTTITTIAAIVANVYRSTTDTVVDPGTIIPSIQALIEEIEDAVDSIPVDYSGLLATIAADYSSSKTYPVVGMYAWQGGVLKRNIVPITTAETYTAAHWTNAVIGDDLSALKSAFMSDDSAGFAAAGNIAFVPSWIKQHYIDTSTGEVRPGASTASVTEAIRIPDGASAIIKTPASTIRYATYDENGQTLHVYVDAFGINIEIPSTEAKYFRLQYPRIDDSELEAVNIRLAYADEIARESEVERRLKDTNDNGYSTEQASSSGNPVVVRDATNGEFNDISISNGAEGEILSICGKNLFNFQHKSRLGLASNGVTFVFDRNTQAYSIRSEEGATATAISADSTCVGCTELDGVTAYHNFHFCMKSDTPVTITPGYAYEPYYDDKISFQLMWVESGSLKMMPIGYEGATIVALAGVEYGVRIRVATGWTGNIVMKPQVEIGGEGTAFEQYRGVDIPLPLSAGSNLFNMPEVAKLISIPNAYVTATFDYINQSVLVESTGPAGNTLITNNSYDGKVNTKDWYYLCKFTPGAVPVLVPGVPEELVGMVAIFVSDGTTNMVQNTTANPVVFMGETGKEYGYRIRVNAGAKFKYLFKPVIATGTEILQQMGTRYPVTSIYTNGSASISATYNKAKLSDEINAVAQIAKGVAKLTGGKIVNALDKLSEAGSVVCFIDDDTTNPTYVQLFHDIFAAENVVGNYAVEMENLDNNPGLDTVLLEYERQGFGMLYHCYKQHGDADRYWESGNPMYDEDLIRTNFYRGLREYKQVGFNSARYWVTPYGVNDQFIQNLAKEADMECLLSCPTSNYSCNAVLTLGSNVKRYNMPRTIFLSDTNNDASIKSFIDGCASAPGLLVVVTHVNSWTSSTIDTNTARLTGLIQYAKAAGCKIQNFMTAYQTFKPLLMLNELF